MADEAVSPEATEDGAVKDEAVSPEATDDGAVKNGAVRYEVKDDGAVKNEAVRNEAVRNEAYGELPPGGAEGEVQPAVGAAVPGGATAAGRNLHPLAWFWIYTGLRAALYVVILGLLWLFGVRGLFGAFVALVLTVPLSYVVLARPRAAMVASIDVLRARRTARTDALDEQLQGRAPAPNRARYKNRSQ